MKRNIFCFSQQANLRALQQPYPSQSVVKKGSRTLMSAPIPHTKKRNAQKTRPAFLSQKLAKSLSHPDIPRNRKRVVNQHILNYMIANLSNPFSLNNCQRTQTYSMRHQSLAWHIIRYCVEHQRIPKNLVFTR